MGLPIWYIALEVPSKTSIRVGTGAPQVTTLSKTNAAPLPYHAFQRLLERHPSFGVWEQYQRAETVSDVLRSSHNDPDICHPKRHSDEVCLAPPG